MRCSINSERGELWKLLVLHMLKNFNICVGKIISSNIILCTHCGPQLLGWSQVADSEWPPGMVVSCEYGEPK